MLVPAIVMTMVVGATMGSCFAASKPVRQGEVEAEHYTCAMHPQIRMHGPGKCPICMMDGKRGPESFLDGKREDGDAASF